MANETSEPSWPQIARRLREIRQSRGWTLHDVERLSGGRWNSAVVGSYERTDRALTLANAIELAKFYQVPFSYLVGYAQEQKFLTQTLIFDLRKFRAYSPVQNLSLFIAWVTGSRQDWNGEILTVRSSDLSILTLLLERNASEVTEYLTPILISISDRTQGS